MKKLNSRPTSSLQVITDYVNFGKMRLITGLACHLGSGIDQEHVKLDQQR